MLQIANLVFQRQAWEHTGEVIFDIRNDSDALFSLFQISVDGIKDLQLMELATRRGSKDFVAGLATCVEIERL
jgi:exonuclease 3'-5' domain-containing protein 1